jgi:hypothetical protein
MYHRVTGPLVLVATEMSEVRGSEFFVRLSILSSGRSEMTMEAARRSPAQT